MSFSNDYMKPKYGEKANLCLHRQLHLHRHCKKCEARFDTWNYEWQRPLPKWKNKKSLD